MAGRCVMSDGKFQPSGISGDESVTFPAMPDGLAWDPTRGSSVEPPNVRKFQTPR